MGPRSDLAELSVEDLTTVIEELTGIFIRLPKRRRLSFTTLSVLHTLSRSGPMRLMDLTATEQVTQPAITQLVTKLEQEGLVERRPDPCDGRGVLVALTAAGRAVVDVRRSDRVGEMAGLVAGLGVRERRAIASAMPAMQRLVELGRGADEGSAMPGAHGVRSPMALAGS
jgi:DNA-binding MarR family transcriptional regulator